MELLETLSRQARDAMTQLLEQARTKPGQIVVVGCSSSEAGGYRIGSHSALELAQAIFDGLYPVVQEHGMYLAAQCCEHLNRALIVEEECMEKYHLEQVNAVPQPKAGGSFATTAWARFSHPVAVERIRPWSSRCSPPSARPIWSAPVPGSSSPAEAGPCIRKICCNQKEKAYETVSLDHLSRLRAFGLRADPSV